MSTYSWKVNKPNSDHLPACSSCRRRKLRCSREGPPCSHCSRTGANCVYDARQRPGLKPGAIEALSRRVALLEQILLENDGRHIVKYTDDGRVIRSHYSRSSRSDPCASNHDEEDLSSDHPVNALDDQEAGDLTPVAAVSEGSERVCRASQAADTVKDAIAQLDNDSMDTLSHSLPSREILVEVVDYFCRSFHHWIPFLHKARWQLEARKQSLSGDLLLVFHAAVAVVLPHLATIKEQIGFEEAQNRARNSRELVMRYAMGEISLRSLQALVILIFEDLNNGELTRSYVLIGLLTRTANFLQLTVEPDASHSKVLMKPLNNLVPASDWTELESRRRLFWCIFLFDRYTSAHTGLNTSFAAEDVNRRLPSDGAYFTLGRPVSCPFFGIWNKTYAKLGVSLFDHVPAKYSEGDRSSEIISVTSPSTVESASSGVDSSKLGAFAYCIEATESLNQITTFFLQQCIDWQNRQDILNWLTRFKELDLRLVHWKHFLPSRWKDSNISNDKSLVNMDPNLTLAHMTHNTSMILLHYPIAFPPIEWTSLVQLPSSCSAETCQLAATEISHIAAKFLQHTEIPFVNSQFSFCLLVAAKALLVLSQVAMQQVDPEFHHLVESLWTISARWYHQDNNEVYRNICKQRDKVDVAANYAQFLEKLHEKCGDSTEYRFNLLDHSCSNLGHSPRTPLNNVISQAQAYVSNRSAGRLGQPLQSGMDAPPSIHVAKRRRTESQSQETPRAIDENNVGRMGYQGASSAGATACSDSGSVPRFSSQRTGPPRSQIELTRPIENGLQAPNSCSSEPSVIAAGNDPGQTFPLQGQRSLNTHTSLMADDLFNLSDTLMHPHYMELDRVITFEDANFYASDYGQLWLT